MYPSSPFTANPKDSKCNKKLNQRFISMATMLRPRSRAIASSQNQIMASVKYRLTVWVGSWCTGRAKISPPALQQLMKRRIGVTYLSLGGRFIGRCEGDQSWDVELRRNQYELTGNQGSSLTLSQAVIGSKIRAQRTVLLRAQRRNRALPLKSEIHFSLLIFFESEVLFNT